MRSKAKLKWRVVARVSAFVAVVEITNLLNSAMANRLSWLPSLTILVLLVITTLICIGFEVWRGHDKDASDNQSPAKVVDLWPVKDQDEQQLPVAVGQAPHILPARGEPPGQDWPPTGQSAQPPASITQLRPNNLPTQSTASDLLQYAACVGGVLAVLGILTWIVLSGLAMRQEAAGREVRLREEAMVVCNRIVTQADIAELATVTSAGASNHDPNFCLYQLTLRPNSEAARLEVYVSCGVAAQQDWETFVRQDSTYALDELPGAAFRRIGQSADEAAMITNRGAFIKVNLAGMSNSDGQGNAPANGKRALLATVLRRAVENQSANTSCVADRVVPGGKQ